jgi:hypothetical protein
MLTSFDDMVNQYGLNIDGVIHVGGHTGEEVPDYLRYTNKVHIFEPIKECFDKIPNEVNKYNCALGDTACQMEFFIANNNASSSLLKPKYHLERHSHITFDTSMTVDVKRLDDFGITDCNFLNLDVQGYELHVLKGALETLKHIKAIYTEVNVDELYENNVILTDLDIWLKELGFKRVWISMTRCNWGDALYVRA